MRPVSIMKMSGHGYSLGPLILQFLNLFVVEHPCLELN